MHRHELTIGALAKLGQVNIQTLRYYECPNLLIPITRKPSGYRVYGSDSVRRLAFIKHAQDLGFTLKGIQELLSGLSSVSAAHDVMLLPFRHLKLVQCYVAPEL